MDEFNKALLFVTCAIVFSGALIYAAYNDVENPGVTGLVISEKTTAERTSEYQIEQERKSMQELDKDLRDMGFSRVKIDELDNK